MRKDDLFLMVICILLCICICEKALAKKRFSPLSKLSIDKTLYSQGDTLTILGKGFIPDYPSIYQVVLENDLETYRLDIEEAKLDKISMLIPSKLPYGDYRLSIKLKSNYLRSKKYSFDKKIKIRPQALLLGFKINEVFLSKFDLQKYLNSSLEEVLRARSLLEEDLIFYIDDKPFDFEMMNLAEGKNLLSISYKHQGFRSINSEPLVVMFLSEQLYSPEIEILSLNPLEANIYRLDTETKLSVNDYVASAHAGSYVYLKAFSGKEIFKTERDLKKILITELKVTGDEYAVLKNNSSDFFNFDNCSLADTLKLRYEFPAELELAPGSILKVKENLGLNNSSADKLQIICEYGGEEPEFVIEDVFSYDEVDESGFAIKSE